jgi:DUF2075 family protein
MPLLDSGSALFAGTSAEFAEMAPASRLTQHLVDAFNSRWGRASESEIRSWRNSLTALASVVSAAGLDKTGTGVELKLPLTDRRIDAFFAGQGPDDTANVVLVELKQWETAAPSMFPDNVLVGGLEYLHPSVQAASYADYLRGSHSAFTEDGLVLHPCAYLHNMRPVDANGLRGVAFEGATTVAPFYVQGDEEALATQLRQHVATGDGVGLLRKVLHGRYSPSPKLIESIAKSMRESPVWTLLDEQRMAFNIVRGHAERAAKSGTKAAVIVTGGPGTGKSVIAAHLLIHLTQNDRYRAAHATGSKAFTTNLRALSRASSAVFRYFNDFMPYKTDENEIEVLICDEAHRIRETSNGRFTGKARKSNMSQVEELMRAARVSVFFLDQRQNVRPGEIGTVATIEETAIRLGVPVAKVALDAQFRCNGCGPYIEWVNQLMSEGPVPVGRWREAGDYDLRCFASPGEMEQEILRLTAIGETARIVAGFCWPWSDPDANNALVDDVVIGDWRRPWNEKSPEQQKRQGSAPRPERHPYTLWATQPERVREVGCIYSAQGFEFDYCGVILGNDLVWREGVGWVGSKDASQDSGILRGKLDQEAIRALLWHTYRVLLTRGMKGTFVYSTDWETQRMLEGLLAGQVGPRESSEAQTGI